MARQRTGDILVGLFVLAMLGTLFVGIMLLTGRSGPADRYYTVYPNVTDIGFGTAVLYEGYPVGRVEAVTPRPADTGMEFLVEFSVIRGWRIPADSVAAVVTPRVLAPLAIEIRGGTSDQTLQPGDALVGIPGQNLFAAMGLLANRLSTVDFSRIDPLLAVLGDSLEEVRTIVSSDGKEALAQLRDLLSSANRALPSLLAELERFSRSLNATADEIRLMINSGNREKVERILSNLDRSSADVQRTTLDTRRLMEQLAKIVESSEGDIHQSTNDARYVLGLLARDIDTIMHNVDATSRNIQEFSREIRANPGLLIRGARVNDAAATP
jgi:phospholipid/cholesterol/gamma-HCH transport system substrate-binding protein